MEKLISLFVLFFSIFSYKVIATPSKIPIIHFIMKCLVENKHVEVKGIDDTKLIFNITDTRGIAKEWAKERNNKNASYDNFSRAMRTHYPSELLGHGTEACRYWIDIYNPKIMHNDSLCSDPNRITLTANFPNEKNNFLVDQNHYLPADNSAPSHQEDYQTLQLFGCDGNLLRE